MATRLRSRARWVTARATAVLGRPTMRSTPSSNQRRAMASATSGLFCWSADTTATGWPATLPPKSSTAIWAATTDPKPAGAAKPPVWLFSTPIRRVSTENCADAGPVAQRRASTDSNERSIQSLPIILRTLTFHPAPQLVKLTELHVLLSVRNGVGVRGLVCGAGRFRYLCHTALLPQEACLPASSRRHSREEGRRQAGQILNASSVSGANSSSGRSSRRDSPCSW